MRSTQYHLGAVLDLWRDSHKTVPNQLHKEKYLELALRLYVLPKLAPMAQGLEKSDFPVFCATVTIGQLENALTVFDTEFAIAVEQGKTAKSTGKNYRAALKQFLQWVEKQPWWKGVLVPSVVQKTPKRSKLTPMPKHKRGPLVRYGLDPQQLPLYLQEELTAFKEFRRTGGLNLPRTIIQSQLGKERGFVRRPKLAPVDASTIQQEEGNILYFLGWYNQQCPNRELHLALLTDINLLEDFIDWCFEERGVSSATGVKMTQLTISIAKWLNYSKTNRRNWSDIPLIVELRNIKNEYREDRQAERVISDTEKWSKKELSHAQLCQVVDYLRTLCADYGQTIIIRGSKQYNARLIRNLSVIARSWQTYLLVKWLTYCPVREEEIRDLVFGESLLRKVNEMGQVIYYVNLAEHKLDKTGKVRRYPLPSILTEDLDLWLFSWRPLILESLESLDGWMRFWNYSPDVVERYQRRINGLKDGTVQPTGKFTVEYYIQENETKLAGVQYRLDAWKTAKENTAEYNRVFFSFGKKDAVAFGQPLNISIFWQTVRRATAIASHELFGEAKWINPHAFRHIAEKHLRLMGKTHLADAFGALIGHSKEMGDEYANQILSEYEITRDIVDNWWLNN